MTIDVENYISMLSNGLKNDKLASGWIFWPLIQLFYIPAQLIVAQLFFKISPASKATL